MNQVELDKKIELLEFVSEMNDLIDKGILRRPSDFQLWLEDVQEECIHCFEEISQIVQMYIKHL
jgi:hypothetical protein